MKRLTEDQAIALLKSQCPHGSAARFAKEHGLSPPYISDVLARRRLPGPKILRALGLRKIVVYEREN